MVRFYASFLNLEFIFSWHDETFLIFPALSLKFSLAQSLFIRFLTLQETNHVTPTTTTIHNNDAWITTITTTIDRTSTVVIRLTRVWIRLAQCINLKTAASLVRTICVSNNDRKHYDKQDVHNNSNNSSKCSSNSNDDDWTQAIDSVSWHNPKHQCHAIDRVQLADRLASPSTINNSIRNHPPLVRLKCIYWMKHL